MQSVKPGQIIETDGVVILGVTLWEFPRQWKKPKKNFYTTNRTNHPYGFPPQTPY
jgi:hypothetical protein